MGRQITFLNHIFYLLWEEIIDLLRERLFRINLNLAINIINIYIYYVAYIQCLLFWK